MYRVIYISALLLACFCASSMQAQEAADPWTQWDFSGHAKYQYLFNTYPNDSLFRPIVGSSTSDNNLEIRLKNAWSRERWQAELDYQFIASHAQSLDLAGQTPGGLLPIGLVINDKRRWWDLTHINRRGDHTTFINRLDRLNVSWTGARMSWRFGRQAISWGNGLMFSTMDIFNPFDPAAIDKEYKAGDDMLYGQFLFENGSDLQATAVVRRDLRTGETDVDESSLALKYHGFIELNEYDVLLAQHYGDAIFGLGGSYSLGGAVLRGDVTWTDTDIDHYLSGVASISYSWVWGETNFNGLLEMFHNGFGQSAGHYSADDLANNPELVNRIIRGELYTLAKNYLGASVLIELSPLLRLTPNVFFNLGDPSALMQFVLQYDWKQDIQILGAINAPLGASGTEYGGIESPLENGYFSTGPGLFVQAAWYF